MRRPARWAGARALAAAGATLGAIFVLGSLAASPAAAQTAGGDAEVRRMIDSLRPATPPAPAAGRTRNLVIEPAAGAAPATASPTSSTSTASPTSSTSTASPTSATATTSPTSSTTTASPTSSPGLSLAIAFEPNSARLAPASGATLGALVAAMISPELRAQRFVIEGHTDATGTPAQNLRLSRERAEQVRLYLVTLGVEGERLRAVGKGASEPANPRDPRSPENRRVRVLAVP